MSYDYLKIAESLIKGQEKVVGPLAWSQAKKVIGLTIDDGAITIKGDGKQIINELVSQYASLFGQASVEVCKESVKGELNKLEEDQIPFNLK